MKVGSAVKMARPFPKLRPGFAVVTTGDSLIVEGGLRRLRLTGSLVTLVIPRLFELLDGYHSAEEIGAELSIKETQFEELVNLLSAHGLVDHVSKETVCDGVPPHVRVYLSRVASLNSSDEPATEDIANALSECVVVIIAPQSVSSAITADLKEIGLRRVHACVNPREMSRDVISEVASSARGVVAVLDVGNDDEFEVITSNLGESAVPVIHASANRSCVQIGPVFFGADSACNACSGRGRDASAAESCQGSVHPAKSQPYDVRASVVAGLLTTEILAVALRLGPPPTPGRLARYILPGFTSTGWEVIPEPGCTACGPTIPPDVTASFVEAYERQASLTPLGLLWNARSSAARRTGTNSARTELEARRSPRHRLASAETDAGAARAGTPEHVLAGILLEIAGEGTPPGPSCRLPGISASDETLGSVDIYVGGEDIASCLPGSVFRYDESEHTLVPVSRRAVALGQLLRTTDITASPGDLAVIFASASKTMRDTGAAIRLAHVEAGYAALRLRMAVNANLDIRFASCWGTDIAEMLELDDRQIITAVALLSCGPWPTTKRRDDVGVCCRGR